MVPLARRPVSTVFPLLFASLLAIGAASAEPRDAGPRAELGRTAMLFGRVVSAGAPVAHALVTEASSGESARTDSRGRFVLSGLSLGAGMLSVETEIGRTEVPMTTSRSGASRAVLSLDAGGVSGRLAGILISIARKGRAPDAIKGVITAVSATTLTVHDPKLSDVRLKTNVRTLVRHGGATVSVANLAVNMTVQAKASLQFDGTLLAQEVDVEDDNGENEDGASGVVKSIDCNSNTMVLTTESGDVTVTFDVNTTFETHDQPASCSDLAVGDDAEVEGTLQGDGSILASKVSFEAPEVEDVEVQGKVKSVNGPSFVVTTESGDVTVTTDGGTAFEKCDGPGALTDVVVDAVVEATGTLQNDGSVLASKVSIECEDDPGDDGGDDGDGGGDGGGDD